MNISKPAGQAHVKYIFKELSSDSLVTTFKNKAEEHADKIICDAVVSHLQGIVGDQAEQSNPSSLLLGAKELEEFKAAAFKEGFDQAQSQYQKIIDDYENKNSFLENLKNGLASPPPPADLVGEYIHILSEILEELIEKLAITLPLDFSKIIKKLLEQLIEGGYNQGNVIIRVNEKHKDFCAELIKKEKFIVNMEDIQVVEDNKLSDSECLIEYNKAKLVYDKSLVKKEIDEIIKQFKTDS